MAIKTVGVGGDYPSPQLYEASLPSVLTEPEVVRILDDLSGLSDIEKTFDFNSTTSPTNNITVETWDAVLGVARVQDFKAENGDIPVIQYGRGGTWGLIVRRNGCDHITVRHLTIEITNTSTNYITDFRGAVATDDYTVIHDNYFHLTNDDTSNYGGITFKTGVGGEAYNNILISGNTNAFYAKGASMDIHNNTIVCHINHIPVLRTGLRYNQNGSMERNAVFNFGPTSSNKDYLQPSPIFNDNASSDESGNVGFQHLALIDQYVDPLNHDWTLKAGNSLEGAAAGGLDIGAIVAGGVTPPVTFKGYWIANFSGVI